ncbi:hypothetical protein WDU94_008004 [Cyamophila willieti]
MCLFWDQSTLDADTTDNLSVYYTPMGSPISLVFHEVDELEIPSWNDSGRPQTRASVLGMNTRQNAEAKTSSSVRRTKTRDKVQTKVSFRKTVQNAEDSKVPARGKRQIADPVQVLPVLSFRTPQKLYRNPYMNFYVRLLQGDRYRGLPANIVASTAGAAWSQMSAAEKRPYQDMADRACGRTSNNVAEEASETKNAKKEMTEAESGRKDVKRRAASGRSSMRIAPKRKKRSYWTDKVEREEKKEEEEEEERERRRRRRERRGGRKKKSKKMCGSRGKGRRERRGEGRRRRRRRRRKKKKKKKKKKKSKKEEKEDMEGEDKGEVDEKEIEGGGVEEK